MAKLPENMLLQAQFFAMKSVLTATLAVWIGAQKKPAEAANLLRETVNALISRLPYGGIPQEHKQAFQENMRAFANGIVDTAAVSWEMRPPSNQRQ